MLKFRKGEKFKCNEGFNSWFLNPKLVMSREDYDKLEDKWYRIDECLPPINIDVLVSRTYLVEDIKFNDREIPLNTKYTTTGDMGQTTIIDYLADSYGEVRFQSSNTLCFDTHWRPLRLPKLDSEIQIVGLDIEKLTNTSSTISRELVRSWDVDIIYK